MTQRKISSGMSVELANFWTAAGQHANSCRRFGADHPAAVEWREELEAIALNTEWPRLRAACIWTLEHPQTAEDRVAKVASS